MNYLFASNEELKRELDDLQAQYEAAKSRGFSINMARGVPAKEQLDLAEDLLCEVSDNAAAFSETGIDTRNYGAPDGLPELKKIFAPLLEASPSEILIGGSSSLNLIYDCIADGMLRGFPESEKPWKDLDSVKFICPVPGYDRHFGICEALGIEMIAVPLNADGPDMDEIERLCAADSAIKGLICVPKYSNPDGFVYSDEVISHLAAMPTAAADFKIFWDNAYGLHDLYGFVPQLSLFAEAKRRGHAARVYTFMSTSKITYAGGGVSLVCAAENQIAHIIKRLSYQSICYDKVNQLRHARFFTSTQHLLDYMTLHAAILRPKFERVCAVLEAKLEDCGIASWHCPRGGYFVSLNAYPGTAKSVHAAMKALGITLTGAGATFPHGFDPQDQNLRLAPTALDLDALQDAIECLCLCVKLCAAEKLLH